MSVSLVPPRSHPRLARAIDVVLAVLALVMLAPLMLVIALAVGLSGGGRVLFSQTRLGRNGVPFRMHKFRTLANEGGDPVAPTNDARITGLGRWLRRWHLDELPQLADVLRGRMALVGPRPEVPANLEAIDGRDLQRLFAVRPGITGATQLAFSGEDDVLAECPCPVQAYRRVLVPAKVQHDLAWLARRSLCGDLAVLFRTPFAVASRRARERSRQRVRDLLADGETGPH